MLTRCALGTAGVAESELDLTFLVLDNQGRRGESRGKSIYCTKRRRIFQGGISLGLTSIIPEELPSCLQEGALSRSFRDSGGFRHRSSWNGPSVLMGNKPVVSASNRKQVCKRSIVAKSKQLCTMFFFNPCPPAVTTMEEWTSNGFYRGGGSSESPVFSTP